ncbi:unnamed protein product [Rotaria sordida]|uniref:Uncharacterized protein n=1 Tax=Rotaria sordida TaxID=392033 RepID=A0A818UXJ5_9BILA|nr:unnamed protein product [Rotaria sordida]
MSRKYSSWASNQPSANSNIPLMKLTTVVGSEQDQLKNLERVEAFPHMYINVDVPPPPASSSMTNIDTRAIQPTMISRHNSSFFAAPTVIANTQTKIWPVEKSSKNSSFESTSSTSKRPHKHKHHHHHHHGDKRNHHHHHHHHHHNNRRHRAKSAESIRNRTNQTFISTPKMMVTNPQYIEQDQQQQQQQQPMIVYREVPNGEGYTVDNTNRLATVPYDTRNESTFVDDQQAPFFVYRDANFQQQPQSIVTDGTPQQLFFNHDQDAFIQQTEPSMCLPQQQQPSQIVYCTDPNQQDYFCTLNNNNFIQQSISPPHQQQQQQQQQQLVCFDNLPTIQPTIINQIPVFNPLSTNTNSQSLISIPQSQLQRTASVFIQQPQSQPQPLQIIQQQPQQLQVIQQPHPIQVIQQPQALQLVQSSQPQNGQILQIASATPQIIQSPPVLQTFQIPTQTVTASPQILYQRPYDPVVVPIQNQQMAAIASPSVLALSQPSYAPSRIIPATQTTDLQGPNMFRHALLRTVAGRTGLPISTAASGGNCLPLIQSTVGASATSNPSLLLYDGTQQSASLPIVPLTQDGLLIPFQSSQTSRLRSDPFPCSGGYPSSLRNFDDIRQQIEQQRVQLTKSLREQSYNRIPSPPVLSTAPRNQTIPYTSGNLFSSATRSSEPIILPTSSTSYIQPSSTGLNYSRPPYIGSTRGSIMSGPSIGPYRPFTP